MNLQQINPLFQNIEIDYLYHFGIDSSMDLVSMFGDIHYVIITRTNESAAVVAKRFAKDWYKISEEAFEFKPLFKTERFNLYKIGPVLIVSHGFGIPSMLICLNEIVKLLIHAKRTDVIFFKLGAADGFNLKPGTLVISSSVVNSRLEPMMYAIECGEECSYKTHLDENLIDDIVRFNQQVFRSNLVIGRTVGMFDFYEEEGRIGGRFLPLTYSKEERDSYFKNIMDAGVKSMDMESLEFAGLCNQLGIKGCIVSAIVVDRLRFELINREDTRFQELAFDLIIQYIIYQINLDGGVNES